MQTAETALSAGHPLTRAERALAGACALSAAADELVHSGPGLRVGDRRVVVAWLRGRAELLSVAAAAAPRCAADDGWGRCYAAPVVDGYCATHAAEDRRPADVVQLAVVAAAPWADDVDDQVADQLAQLVVDDGCPACTGPLTIRDGLIVCVSGCDALAAARCRCGRQLDGDGECPAACDGDGLVDDGAGWMALGVVLVVLAWLAAVASWCWLMVLAWQAFIRWAVS